MPNGSFAQLVFNIIMQPTSYVFNAEHSSMPLDFAADIPLQDLKKFRNNFKSNLLKLTDFRLRGVFPGGGSQVFHDCI